jgi:lambda repressor-like predicted transcriptional regulator
MTIQMTAPAPTGGWDGRDLLDPDFDTLGDADDYGPWVESAPFRAHVKHLMAETGVAWRTLAVLADVPPQSVEHLLRGRSGRPVPRLHPLIADRLFHLTHSAVSDAAARQVHAGRTQALLGCLSERGWMIREIARRTQLPETGLAALAAGQQPACSQLVAATVKAAAQALWDRGLPTRQLGTEQLSQQARPTSALAAA